MKDICIWMQSIGFKNFKSDAFCFHQRTHTCTHSQAHNYKQSASGKTNIRWYAHRSIAIAMVCVCLGFVFTFIRFCFASVSVVSVCEMRITSSLYAYTVYCLSVVCTVCVVCTKSTLNEPHEYGRNLNIWMRKFSRQQVIQPIGRVLSKFQLKK